MRIAVIPMRGGSKGIPGKNLRTVGGQSLAQRAIIACHRAGFAVWVSTDDPQISRESEKYGARVIPRPSELALDTSSSESVLLHALETLNLGDDVVAFVQATSPFIESQELSAAAELVESGEADVAFAAKETHSFDWVQSDKLWGPLGHPKDFRPRRQDLPDRVSETGAFYVFKANNFKSAGFRFHGLVRPVMVAAEFAIDIDTMLDLEWANKIGNLWLMKGQAFTASDEQKLGMVTHLLIDFDGVQTDNRVIVDENGNESVIVSRGDGLGIAILKSLGFEITVISSEKNAVVARRCEKLEIGYEHGVSDKGDWISSFQEKEKLSVGQCLFLGNDVNDLPVRPYVGTLVGVSDSHPTFALEADFCLQSAGGSGAIRELADLMNKIYLNKNENGGT